MKTEERSRHTVWMEDTVWQRVQEHYKQRRMQRRKTSSLTKAILFYCGYLQSEYAGDFLPKILGETLEAILSMFGDRIGKLLLKQAVEQNVCNHILASDTDIDAADIPENARYELSGGAADEWSDLVPGGASPAKAVVTDGAADTENRLHRPQKRGRLHEVYRHTRRR